MKVYSLNVSEKKGVLKRPVESAKFIEGRGIEGDAHKGSEKQVSFLAWEDVVKFREEKGIELTPGVFAENIDTEGLDLSKLRIGDRLKIGEAELEISHIGKKCHEFCKIKELTGECIMPTKGYFAKVLRSGTVKKKDEIIIL